MNDFHKHKNLEEYFIKKIKDSLKDQNFSISEEVEYYLVHLMKKFAHSENFFQKTEEGQIENRALVLRFHDALFDHPSKRYHHLKKLGDSALYQAGVFYDGLLHKMVDVGYYIAMGRRAYASLANQKTVFTKEKTLADLFKELSESFPDLVELLALCCERDQWSDLDLLKWIERYQKTKSQKAKSILAEKGIFVESLISDRTSQ